MECELYESFEELKFRLFKTLNLPEELLIRIGFYEVNERYEFFDETFIEDFVRVSDVLGSWDLEHQVDLTDKIEDTGEKVTITIDEDPAKIYLRFRYYLEKEVPKTILGKIEKIFNICEMLRLMHVNRINLSIEEVVNVVSIIVRMRNADLSIRNMSSLIADAKYILQLVGKHSRMNIKVSFQQVLVEIKKFDQDTFSILKNYLMDIYKSTLSYRAQNFKVNLETRTIFEYNFPSNVLLLINPTAVILTTSKVNGLLEIPFQDIRKMLLNKNFLVIILNITQDDFYEKVEYSNNEDAKITQSFKKIELKSNQVC